MGAKDDVVTPYFENPVVFCDFVNGAVFGGEQVLRPERLKCLPREVIAQLPWETDGKVQKKTVIRDTVKQVCLNTMYIIFICENQSEVHYGMPIRMLLYDSIQYGEQMRVRGKENKDAGNLRGSAEYLSGIHKGEQLMPVVSVVFYYGDNSWDGPLTLEEMLYIPEEAELIREYVPKYKIHLVEPKHVDVNHFKGDWKIILEVLKHNDNKKELMEYVENHRKELDDLSAEAGRALLTMLGQDVICEDGKEDIAVCRALEELKEEGRAEGKAEGKAEAEINLIRRKLQRGFTAEAVSEWLELEYAYVEAIADLHRKYPDYSDIQIVEEYNLALNTQ